jgi:release factor glutamine methyltransferase
MRAFFRYAWLPFYRRWALWYVQRERCYIAAGLKLWVPPGVFHPGIYFSTPVFISFLQGIDFQDKKVLDIGTGTGFLALFAAKKGGIVTALDINPLAVETSIRNAKLNDLSLAVLKSDLFDSLPPQPFDFILINPPYYPRRPHNFSEHAFFAGENLDYFEKLFGQLPAYLAMQGLNNPANTSVDALRGSYDPATYTWLILSEDCNFIKMKEIAAKHGFQLQVVFEKKKWGERFFVAQVDTVVARD